MGLEGIPKQENKVEPGIEQEGELQPGFIRQVIEGLLMKKQAIPGTIARALSPEATPSQKFWANGLKQELEGIEQSVNNLAKRLRSVTSKPELESIADRLEERTEALSSLHEVALEYEMGAETLTLIIDETVEDLFRAA
ncbi:MAG: hypothetical protein G01um101433_952, partial [Parcubacteria group bacterium Gr01-1014_33]